jgi:hypothetical protein
LNHARLSREECGFDLGGGSGWWGGVTAAVRGPNPERGDFNASRQM